MTATLGGYSELVYHGLVEEHSYRNHLFFFVSATILYQTKLNYHLVVKPEFWPSPQSMRLSG